MLTKSFTVNTRIRTRLISIFTIGFFLCSSFIFSHAQSVYLSVDKNATEGLTQPERIVNDNGEEGIEIEYSFPGVVANKKKQDDEIYDYLAIDGFGRMSKVGSPALPVRNDLIAIPVGSAPIITILEVESYEYSNYRVHPALPPATDTYGALEPEFVIDSSVYSQNAFFPSEVVELLTVQISRGTPMAIIQVRPIQFNPATKTVKIYNKIRYRVSFGKSDKSESTPRKSPQPNKILQNVLLNSSVFKNSVANTDEFAKSSEGDRADYIIVTTPEFENAADTLAAWKKQLGYEVDVVVKSDWTSAQVKDSIQSRYFAWSPAPEYFVIIGDHDDVPGQEMGGWATDLYYACVDGIGDYYPDMARGRISVTNATQAMDVVLKIVNYERNPINDPAFYSTAMNAAYFQHAGGGYAERRFSQTAEQVLQYMVTEQSFTMNREYYTEATVNPTNWNNGYYSAGEPIPSHLLKPGFAWDGNSTGISSQINDGRLFVLHRDHGAETLWGDPHYTTTDINALTNGNKLPIVFSINCLTGKYYYSECFAEAFLRNTNGGAAGVFGMAEVSYSGYNDALAMGLFDAIWANPGLAANFTGSGNITGTITPHSEIFSLGDVMNQGLLRMVETWGDNWGYSKLEHELFTYFGDPAMKIWTAQPTQIIASHTDSLDCGAMDIIITGANIDGLATLYYKGQLIGKTQLIGGSGTIDFISPVDDQDPVSVLTISNHNNIPYIAKIPIRTNCTIAPIADFTADNTLSCNSEAVTFTDLSYFSPTSWNWSFSPNNVNYIGATTSSSQHPVVEFTSPGNYTVTLVTENSYGSNTIEKTNYITVENIIADFSAEKDTGRVQESITFTDQSQCTPTSWLWTVSPATVSFTNGTDASSQNPEIQFESMGLYAVTLEVSNVFGSESITKNIQINQEFIIGTGTLTDIHLPIECYYGYTYSQSIYDQSYLSDPLEITKISYYWNGLSTWSDNIQIYMGNTSKSDFSGTTDWLPLSNLTLVYDGLLSVTPTQGWIDITLNTPFYYNGVDNLVIAVDENTPGYHSSSDDFYCSELNPNVSSIYYYNLGVNPNPAAPPSGVLSIYSPNIKIEYVQPAPMVYLGSTSTQNNTSAIYAGTTNQQIIGIEIETEGGLSPLELTEIDLNTNGTTDNTDILNSKIFYTGTSDVFNSSVQFGTTSNSPDGTYTISGNQILDRGTNYFWLVYDITTDTLKAGNFVDAECTGITVGGSAYVPSVTAPAGNREINKINTSWTWMIYLYEDGTGLNGADDLNELEANGSILGQINYIVLYDAQNDANDGIYLVEQDPGGYNSTIISPIISTVLGTDPNMDDWHTLRDFVLWVGDNYPAKHYGLTVWDHGSGIFDFTGIFGKSPEEEGAVGDMKLWEMDDALSEFTDSIGRKIDVLGFDVCLLGQIETAYQMKDFADYVIASEKTEPGDGWDYVAPFARLNSDPSMDAETISAHIVNDYITSYSGGSQGTSNVTQAATSTSSLENDLIPALNEFADTLIAYVPSYKGNILSAIASSWNADYNIDHKDLGDFALEIVNDTDLPVNLRNCAQSVLDNIALAVVAEGHTGVANSDVTGQKIWLTVDISQTGINETYYTDTTNYLKFSKTRWDEFLYALGADYPMVFSSATTTQNQLDVGPGTTNQHIIGVEINTTHSLSPLPLSSFTFNTNGSTDVSDILNAKVYYTGGNSSFASLNQFGSTVSNPDGTFTISGSQDLIEGSNYFWLTYDIDTFATIGNYIDGECTLISVAGNDYIPDSIAPTGYRVVSPVTTIGSGTITNTHLPIECFYGYTYSQTIYNQSHLSTPMDINKISYYWSGTNTWSDNIQIYMGNTSRTDFSVSTDWIALSELTLVYDGILSVTRTPGWLEITLNTPFFYNGVDNLVIAVDENTPGYHSSSDEFYCSNLDGNYSSIYYYSDGTNPDPATPPYGNRSLSSPNIKIEYSPPTPMVYLGSTTTQNDTSIVFAGSTNQKIIGIEIETEGGLSPLELTELYLNTNGTTDNAAILNSKVYYTGISDVFNSSVLFGTTSTPPEGTYTISGNQTLSPGKNYFWLTYDIIDDTLMAGNFVDAECTAITLSGSAHIPSVISPYGQREIYVFGVIDLPWVENFEGVGPDLILLETTPNINGIPLWSYENTPNGRLRFEVGPGFYHGGNHAATLDAQISGTYAENNLIATLNLAKYSTSTDLGLSFYFMHHGEESNPNDKVWIRGNVSDPWIEIYDLFLNQGTYGTWNYVDLLDIDQTLSSAGQSPGTSFQVRFGQEDNYPATTTTSSDGYTFDDIMISGSPLNYINIISPNGNNDWMVGSNQKITWSSEGTSGDVLIEYSTNNGIDWNDIIASTPDNGTYPWTVSGPTSENCLIRVRDTYTGISDVSDSVFIIRDEGQQIVLSNGWNIFSLNITPEDTAMMSIIQPLINYSQLEKIQNEAGAAIERNPITGGWIDNIHYWKKTEGYKIRVNTYSKLNISGTVPIDLPLNIPLTGGWNIISYPVLNSQDALDALEELTISDNLQKVQNETGAAIEPNPIIGGWIDNIGDFQPGEGYKIRVELPDNLSIGNSTDKILRIRNTTGIADSEYYTKSWNGNGLDHMNIYIALKGSGLQMGDEIGIFDGDLCVGAGRITNPNLDLLSMVASVDDPATEVIDGFIDGNSLHLKVWESKTGEEYVPVDIKFLNSTKNQFEAMGTAVIEFNSSPDNIELWDTPVTGLGNNYPNPFSGYTSIPFTIGKETKVDIRIYDILGQEVAILLRDTYKPGSYKVDWEISSKDAVPIMPGIYFVRLMANDQVFMKSIEVQGE